MAQQGSLKHHVGGLTVAVLASCLVLTGRGDASPSLDEPGSVVFQALSSFCIQHDGDNSEVASLAVSQGWTAVPAAKVPNPVGEDLTLQHKAAWIKQDGAVTTMVFAGTGTGSIEDVPVQAKICAVAEIPGDQTGADELATWASVPAQQYDDSKLYVFLNEPGGHKGVADREDMVKVAPSGRLRIVEDRSRDGASLMAYVAVADGAVQKQ